MGIAWGDAQGDGRFDLFITHLASENNTYWRQASLADVFPTRSRVRSA